MFCPVRTALGLLLAGIPVWAQGNYEVQVYGSDLVPAGHTMLEFHTNFTAQGAKTVQDGVLPTEHAWHETLEITHGFTSWFETGFYTFLSDRPGDGAQWVGNHIRPRFAIPEEWRWPVGLSVSNEIGYQRRAFSVDTWTWELRPIIDKKLGRWYGSFNPTLDRSFHGENATKGFAFSPNAKFSYDFTRRVSGGIEYYGSLGPVTGFDPLSEQEQQIVPAIDLNVGPRWEIDFGVGVGMTRSTDHLLVKLIVGYRFSR